MHNASAGGQIALLFEDLFKKMNGELIAEAKKTLAKAARTGTFDAAAHLRSDIITNALETALATGCWNIKRFRVDRKGATQARKQIVPLCHYGWVLVKVCRYAFCYPDS